MDVPKVLIFTLYLCPETFFERHTKYHLKELAFTFIMMLVFSPCLVSLNNSILYMAHSIPLACFHVIFESESFKPGIFKAKK